MNADPDEQPVPKIRDLVTRFCTDEGTVKAVDGSSFDLYEGETLGIVGESGFGKSVTVLSMLQLVGSPSRIERGSVRHRGGDLLEKGGAKMRSIRGNDIAMMLQNPMTSLNPVFTVGGQISQVIKTHQDVSDVTTRERTIELMIDVGIPGSTSRVDNYLHQFSGRMHQRALLAMAISCEPDILIAGEPTAALDVTIEAQIFNVLDELQERCGISIIFITHGLGVVARTCDRVAVAYGGRVAERADVDDLFENPWRLYTRGLMWSIPRLTDNIDRLTPVKSDVSNLTDLPSNCSFHPWCPHVTTECESYDPELREVEPGRKAACLRTRGYDLSPPTIETGRAETGGGGPTAPATDGGTSR